MSNDIYEYMRRPEIWLVVQTSKQHEDEVRVVVDAFLFILYF